MGKCEFIWKIYNRKPLKLELNRGFTTIFIVCEFSEKHNSIDVNP